MSSAATAHHRPHPEAVERLLERVLAGDPRALDQFVCEYNGTIERSIRRVLRRRRGVFSEEDIRDLVGDVWLSLLEDDKRTLRRFDPGRGVQLATWIDRVARNKAIDRLRTRRLLLLGVDLPPTLADAPSAAPSPTEEVEAAESLGLAQEALAQLSPKDRGFLEAWYLERCSPAELAGRLGISVATVYSRRCKIQQKLARAVRGLDRACRNSGPGRWGRIGLSPLASCS